MRHRKTIILSAITYALSLFLPPFILAEGHSSFILGFVCLAFGFEKVAWLANPLHFASVAALALMKKTHLAAVSSAAAIAIALTTIAIKELPRNESGALTAVVGYGPAFYLWIASMLIILVAAIRGLLPSKEFPSPPR